MCKVGLQTAIKRSTAIVSPNIILQRTNIAESTWNATCIIRGSWNGRTAMITHKGIIIKQANRSVIAIIFMKKREDSFMRHVLFEKMIITHVLPATPKMPNPRIKSMKMNWPSFVGHNDWFSVPHCKVALSPSTNVTGFAGIVVESSISFRNQRESVPRIVVLHKKKYFYI